MAKETGVLPNLVVIPKGYAALNPEGLALANLAAWHMQRIGNTGILAAAPPEGGATQPLGSLPNPAATQRRVWLEEPPGSEPFDEQNTIFIPSAPGTDVPVLTLIVPKGHDGVIKWIANTALNETPPFVAGNLVWKISINGRPVRNFGNITQRKGTVFQGREISPIRIFSGDVVVYSVQLASGATLAGQTACSLTGYFYPSKGIS